MIEFTPTDEQVAALEIFGRGDSMVIEALAGTGKTSTLRLLAESTDRFGRYLAFNKAIVEEVKGTLPDNFQASTVHALAMRAVGKPYRHRLGSSRMRSREVAQRLDIRSFTVVYGSERKTLADGWLAGYVMRAVSKFCQSADREPGLEHFPYLDGIDVPLLDGTRTHRNNDKLREAMLPALKAAWADLSTTDGSLRFQHEHYLKLWHLTDPHATCSVILFDEAQDANPIMADIIAKQDHVQRVYVGDPNQAIYEFTGAVDAMSAQKAEGLTTSTLSQSFRFGHAIADRANRVLAQLGSEQRVKGLGSIDSSVGPLDGVEPDAILTRTNACAVDEMLSARVRGRLPHLVGGGDEVIRFAQAARDLKGGGSTWHPELACFSSWGAVQDYVENDPQGGELRLLVNLVDDYGVPTILEALENMTRAEDANLLVSTAHKAKGRQWPVVKIADDFAEVEPSDAELRLKYVAITRAQVHVDESALAPKPQGVL